MTDGRYTRIAMLFHWVIAAGIVANVTLAWVWPYLGDSSVRPAIDTHKSIGITILGLAILRVLWRLTHVPPAFPTRYQDWERRVSGIVHGALYLLIFVMPLSGWIMDSAYKDAATHPMALFGLVPWPRIGAVMALDPATKLRVHDMFGATHSYAAWALYALVGLHVAGALKHQFVDRHRELQRMWPGREPIL